MFQISRLNDWQLFEMEKLELQFISTLARNLLSKKYETITILALLLFQIR